MNLPDSCPEVQRYVTSQFSYFFVLFAGVPILFMALNNRKPHMHCIYIYNEKTKIVKDAKDVQISPFDFI